MKNKILRPAILLPAGLLAVLAALLLPGLLRNYTVNRPDRETQQPYPAAMSLYSGYDLGFSFLYPAGLPVGWSGEDGAAVYLGSAEELPYVLVCRTDKSRMSPEKYFRTFDKYMLDCFTNVRSTPIQEVVLGDKTLYLTRYICTNVDEDLVVDRYVELYKRCYIQYTAVCRKAGEANTPLYYAASTLRLADDAYAGAYSEKCSRVKNAEMGMGIALPDMLQRQELTIGFFASNENAVILSVLCTADDGGQPIYNRQDFIDRAAASPEFVAGQLGADSASFTEGQERRLGGKSFFCYPMEMLSNGQAFSGVLCLANADETGCWLLCYAVRDGCPEHDKLLSLCAEAAESIQFDN